MTRRQSLFTDILAAIGLLCLTAVAGIWAFLYAGMSGWASNGEEGPNPLTVLFCYSALPVAITALAGWRRYWVTAVLHGLLALAVLALGAVWYTYEHRHDDDYRPGPLPSGYHPCYSGSDCSATGG